MNLSRQVLDMLQCQRGQLTRQHLVYSITLHLLIVITLAAVSFFEGRSKKFIVLGAHSSKETMAYFRSISLPATTKAPTTRRRAVAKKRSVIKKKPVVKKRPVIKKLSKKAPVKAKPKPVAKNVVPKKVVPKPVAKKSQC